MKVSPFYFQVIRVFECCVCLALLTFISNFLVDPNTGLNNVVGFEQWQIIGMYVCTVSGVAITLFYGVKALLEIKIIGEKLVWELQNADTA